MSEYFTITFTIGIQQRRRKGKDPTYHLAGSWANRPDWPDPNTQLISVTLELPESLWAMPQAKGRLESRMREEFELMIEELSGG